MHVHAQQPHPQSPTWDHGDIAGVTGWNGKGLCQVREVYKPSQGKLTTDVCLCGSANTAWWSMVNGIVLRQRIE